MVESHPYPGLKRQWKHIMSPKEKGGGGVMGEGTRGGNCSPGRVTAPARDVRDAQGRGRRETLQPHCHMQLEAGGQRSPDDAV